MKNKKRSKLINQEKIPTQLSYHPPFPRPICLEKCTMDNQKSYNEYILKTLRAFSNETHYYQKFPHKLEGSDTWSLDVKSRVDKYRLLFKVENNICKIINLCIDTHK